MKFRYIQGGLLELSGIRITGAVMVLSLLHEATPKQRLHDAIPKQDLLAAVRMLCYRVIVLLLLHDAIPIQSLLHEAICLMELPQVLIKWRPGSEATG